MLLFICVVKWSPLPATICRSFTVERVVPSVVSNIKTSMFSRCFSWGYLYFVVASIAADIERSISTTQILLLSFKFSWNPSNRENLWVSVYHSHRLILTKRKRDSRNHLKFIIRLNLYFGMPVQSSIDEIVSIAFVLNYSLRFRAINVFFM